MFLHGRINSVPISVISFLRQLGVIWNVLGMKKIVYLIFFFPNSVLRKTLLNI
ncbi:hypothetical protein JHK82_035029 [Glycine max]|nr:hypothetical protein JHK82_035029 [Glycine max]